MATLLERLDAHLASFLSDWNLNSTVLIVIIASLLLYPILFPVEADTHPLLLARQSAIDPIRNKFQSAIHRSPEAPPGGSLKSGFELKDAGAARWASGRDGDLRDVWREVLMAGTMQPGWARDGSSEEKLVPTGKIQTVLGREEIVEHDVQQMSKQIQIIGKHLKAKGCKQVAIYLPNNVEYLLTIFACSFYGISPILLPYNLPHPAAYALINATTADGLVCAAGSLPLDGVAKECSKIRNLVWVVEKTSRHMDWHGVPHFAKNRLSVNVWHDVVQENLSKAEDALPTNATGDAPTDIITFWDSPTKPQIIPMSHGNMVAAIAALISALPLVQRVGSGDVVLPASSFHQPYVLCQTLAALYTHADLAITSVAQPGVEMATATRGIRPTVVIASAETLHTLHKNERYRRASVVEEVAKYGYSRSLAAGHLPKQSSLLFRMLSPSNLISQGTKPLELRLILTSDRLDTPTPALSSRTLSELRIMTRARICYALTAPRVAGAVAQTHVYDYRVHNETDSVSKNFGIPLSCVEIWLEDRENDVKVAGAEPEGEIIVSGPAVCGYNRSTGKGEVKLGVKGKFGEDGTLSISCITRQKN